MMTKGGETLTGNHGGFEIVEMIAWVQRVIRNQLRLKLVDQSTEGHAIEEALHRLDAHMGVAVGLHLDP